MTNRFEFLTTPITTHEHTTEKKVNLYVYALIYLHIFHIVSLDVVIYLLNRGNEVGNQESTKYPDAYNHYTIEMNCNSISLQSSTL